MQLGCRACAKRERCLGAVRSALQRSRQLHLCSVHAHVIAQEHVAGTLLAELSLCMGAVCQGYRVTLELSALSGQEAAFSC